MPSTRDANSNAQYRHGHTCLHLIALVVAGHLIPGRLNHDTRARF